MARTSPDQLAARHPNYSRRLRTWELCHAMWEGWPEVEPFLGTYIREGPDAFALRLERLYFLSFLKPVLKIWASYVFGQRVERDDGGSDAVRELWANADRRGRSIQTVMREAFLSGALFGDCPLTIDMPGNDGTVKSRADQRKAGWWPYLVANDARMLIDWQLDPVGQPIWLRFEEELEPERDPWEGSGDKRVIRYTTWTRVEWITHRVVIESEGEGEDRTSQSKIEDERDGRHPVREVPVVMLRPDAALLGSKEFRPKSIATNLARLNQAIMCYGSLLDEGAYQQAIPILNYEKGENEQEATQIDLGPHNAWGSPHGTRAPTYISRPVENLDFILRQMGTLRGEFYRMAHLGWSSLPDRPSQMPSGIAQEWAFSDTNEALAWMAAQVEDAEIRIARTAAAWAGEREWKGWARYPRKFGVSDFERDIADATAFKRVVRSPMAKRIAEKRITAKYLADESAENLENINAEIDELPDPDEITSELEAMGEDIERVTPGVRIEPPGRGSEGDKRARAAGPPADGGSGPDATTAGEDAGA